MLSVGESSCSVGSVANGIKGLTTNVLDSSERTPYVSYLITPSTSRIITLSDYRRVLSLDLPSIVKLSDEGNGMVDNDF